jgi:hypothetical protein
LPVSKLSNVPVNERKYFDMDHSVGGFLQ